MAEKVKEIRVLLEDGSFSEAYPIGADASNIDLNSGKNLETALEEDYVKNTGYATYNKGGVIKLAGGLVQVNGQITPNQYTYETYQNQANNVFVGKGTLENVITGKNLETANNKVTTISESSTDTEYPSAKSVYDYTLGSSATTETTGETISVNTLADSRLNIDLKGNTSQETTTGKNKLNTIEISQTTANGITCTYNSATQEINFNGTCDTNNTTFTISNSSIDFTSNLTTVSAHYVSGSASGTCVVRNFNSDYSISINFDIASLSNSTPIISKTATATFTSPRTTIRFDNGSVTNNFKIKLMTADSANTDWEKFTYGASPNPSYLQNVNVVTGDNTIKVEGKNLLAYTLEKLKSINTNGTWADNIYTYHDATYTINNDLTITVNAPSSHQTSSLILENSLSLENDKEYILNGCPDGGGISVYALRIYTGNNYVSEIGSGRNFVFSNQDTIRLNVSANIGVNNLIFKPMIRNASELDDTYIPYVSQTYPINLGTLELCKIRDYQDYLYKNNGKWYVHKAINKVVLNGSENWSLQSVNDYGIANFKLAIVDYIPNKDNYSLCDKFSPQTSLIAVTQTTGYFLNVSRALFIRADSTIANTLADFKTWLSNNNITLYYVLATPTEEEITDETLIAQLDNLYNAKSYSTTNISQENDNLPFILNVTSFNDTLNGRISSNGDRIDTLIEEVEETIDIINGEVI